MSFSSWEELSNASLTHIGASRIMSFTDPGIAAKLVKNNVYRCRDLVLRSHLWNCATERVVMSPIVGTPAFDYTYSFALPSDFLRPISMGDLTDFEVEGRNILANDNSINLTYVQSVSDPTALDVLCSECIALYLAFTICTALTQNGTLKGEMFDAYTKMLRKAKHVDATEAPGKELSADLWYDSRFQ